MSQRYKGRLIDPRAQELKDGTGWTAEVYVAEDIGPDTIDTQFVLPGVFPTREAALEAALGAGKRQVDGRQLEHNNELRARRSAGPCVQRAPSVGDALASHHSGRRQK